MKKVKVLLYLKQVDDTTALYRYLMVAVIQPTASVIQLRLTVLNTYGFRRAPRPACRRYVSRLSGKIA